MEWVIPAILLVLAVWGSLIHRRLIRLQKAAVEAWPPLEACLRRRHDIVGPLVLRVEAHAPKERRPLDAMIKARSAATMADLSPMVAGRTELALANAIRNVLALGRTYPELGTDLTFRRLETELASREAEIARATESFNDAALAFNKEVLSAPAIVIAKYMNIFKIEYFGLTKEEEVAMATATSSGFWSRP